MRDSRASASILVAFAFALTACTGSTDDPQPPDVHAPGAVAGKPIVQTPTGLAIANELVVGFHETKTPSEVDFVAAALDGRHVWTAPRSGYHVFRFDDAAATSVALSALRADPEVSEAMRHRIAGGTGIGTSPDILRGLQWNLTAMRIGTTGGHGSATGITVAVLDTGIAYEDRDDATGTYVLAPAFNATPFANGYDFINDDPNANDDNGHGTHIAGVIGASEGIAAVAPGATLMPVKVLDSSSQGTELALAEGIFYAVENGADVINMSLAFPPSFFPSRLLQRAIAEAATNDVVMVGAAGNDAAPVVSYPAAFRDVVAVGATRLQHGARYRHTDEWTDADRHLRHAAYSNTGRLIDVVAPAGVIDSDSNGDGEPEATLAMSFQGDPTQLDYFFYAGTSQAAAMVSGTAAVMLAQSPALHGDQVTAILGETANAKNRNRPLDRELGRGLLQADRAIDGAGQDQSGAVRPKLFVGINLTLQERGAGDRYGRAEVEVVDADGNPVKGADVYGSFTGGVYDSSRQTTKQGGIAIFKSPTLLGRGNLVAFQVEAVIVKTGDQRVVVRPSGFFRIDSCSLELLTAFASAAGIGTSPGPVIDPILSSPITLLMPQISVKQVPTLLLLNFSWGLATVPMAVAVDAAWFNEQFPQADQLTVTSSGTGIGTSPYHMDRDTSFPTPIPASIAPSDDVCIDLHVRTFDAVATGIGTSPGREPLLAVNCGSSCGDYQLALAEMWTSYATGIGTSPVWPGGGVPQSLWLHLASMIESYVTFGNVGDSAPVGHYRVVLDAAGLGLAPISTGNGSNGAGTQAMGAP